MIIIEEGVVSSVDLKGGAGKDVIIHKGPGRVGNNEIHGGNGNDYIELGNDITVSVDLFGDGGNDYIQGGPNDDTIEGGGGDDQILGGDGIDTISGDSGSDMITGGLAADILYGHGGPDVFYWTKYDSQVDDGQDSIINGGSGSDTMVITAGDGGEDITVSQNASNNIVITWNNESLALTGISIEGLDINLADGADTFTVEDILGSGVTSIYLDLGNFDAEAYNQAEENNEDYDPIDYKPDSVLLKGSSGNDSYVLDSADGLVNVSRVGVVDVIISNADRTLGKEDELTIRTYGGSDTINAAAVEEDLLAMKFITGFGDDILIGTPFDDLLDSGAGSDIVTGGAGVDVFRLNMSHGDHADKKSLVEI